MSSLLAKNEGPLDRSVRFIIGLALVSLVFVGPHTRWGYVGIVLIVTAFTGSCPLYSLFGLSTCPVRPTPTAD